MPTEWSNGKVDAYKLGVGFLQELEPEAIDGYHRFTGSCFAGGTIDIKNKQLVALGISLFANNEVCTLYHAQEALAHGASAREIAEVAMVAAAVGSGHSMSQSVNRLQDALHAASSAGL